MTRAAQLVQIGVLYYFTIPYLTPFPIPLPSIENCPRYRLFAYLLKYCRENLFSRPVKRDLYFGLLHMQKHNLVGFLKLHGATDAQFLIKVIT